MREIIRRALSRPVGILVAFLAVAVMGVLSFLNIPVQLLPEGFEARRLTIWASLRESSPEEAERFVAIPIEEALGTVGGIDSILTRCERGSVRVTLELKRDADPAEVERDVRDRMARVEADLPDEVDRLHVRRHGAHDRPIIFFACTAAIDHIELSDFVEDVVLPRLESVDGVARADAWGLLKRSVRIFLDQEEVARRNLDLRDLLRRLRGDNLSADLGDVRDGERTAFVRADMEFGSLDEIAGFPVLLGVRLADVARVEVVPSLDQGLSRYNRNAVLAGMIHKAAGANTVDVSHRVRDLFLALQARHSDVAELELIAFFDQGEKIESSLATLYRNALYGGVLAVLILYAFFRRLRMTLLVAAALPLSLTIAVTVLYLAGDSLNMATMMGLTLAVGMLIDNAIVVVESILRRRETGDLPRPAAAEGTGEVALAIVTATLTTIVVFMPAIFLSGETEARLWLASIGLPIGYALLASLVVALVLVPLGTIYLRRHRDAAPRAVHGLAGGSHTRYSRFLSGALRQRFLVVVASLLVIASGVVPLSGVSRKSAMGRGGGPVRVMLRFPRHYTLPDADEAVRNYEDHVLSIRESSEIEGIYANFDRRGGTFWIWQTPESRLDRDALAETVREGWPRVPGVWTSLETGQEGRTTRVTLEGEDPSVLEGTMERIEARLKLLPSVTETRREREQGLSELRVRIDPQALERGSVSPDLLRGVIGWILRGARLRDYRGTGRDLPLLLELDPEQAVDVGDLGSVLIPTDDGPRPLSTLTQLEFHSAPSAVERRDGRRVAELEVVGGEDDEAFHGEVSGILRGIELPPGVRFEVGGSWEDLQASLSELLKALGLGGILVFLLTGVLFESLLLPLAVVCAILPALSGALWALLLAGKPLDELAMLGGILLVGVVVNNGIVLVDRVQQYRRAALPLRASITAAGRDRLRPVAMTALTTIAGLLPMAMLRGTDDGIPYDGLATAVIGGLVVSTVVTLILVPVIFSLFVDLGQSLQRVLRRSASGLGGRV